MNNKQTKVSIHILYHLYYKDSINELDALNHLLEDNSKNLSINLNHDIKNIASFSKKIKEKHPKANIITTPNIGKDVGGKLALINNYLKLGVKSSYLLLLHDKKSPQTLNGQEWNNQLLKITKPENTSKIFSLFENNKEAGIICAQNYISNEYNKQTKEFNTTNNELLMHYIKKFDIKINDYSFVAGNMFWIRSAIYEKFFSENDPLELRSYLEKGNVLDNTKGTHSHSLERIFSWIATNNGYTIKQLN